MWYSSPYIKFNIQYFTHFELSNVLQSFRYDQRKKVQSIGTNKQTGKVYVRRNELPGLRNLMKV